MFDVVLPVPGSPSCCPSLSFSLLLVQMQQKSIIIFSLLKFSLAELKMNLLSETRLRTALDAAWVLISMPGNSGCREVINAEATEAVYCHPQLGEQLPASQHCLPHVMGMSAWEFRAARIPFHSL